MRSTLVCCLFSGRAAFKAIKWIQSFHSPLLDQLMVFVSNLGSEDFYLLFGPMFFWCIGIGLGMRLLMLLLGSFYLNDVLKETINTMRPMVEFPDQVRLPEGARETVDDGVGNVQGAFPSGHAQHATVFWTFIGLWVRRPLVWVGCMLLIILICFSRIYLGVHWPVDIIGGIGMFCIGVFLFLPKYIEALSPQALNRLILIVVAISFIAFLGDHSVFRAKVLGTLAGALLGYRAQQRFFPFEVRSVAWKQAVKIVLD